MTGGDFFGLRPGCLPVENVDDRTVGRRIAAHTPRIGDLLDLRGWPRSTSSRANILPEFRADNWRRNGTGVTLLRSATRCASAERFSRLLAQTRPWRMPARCQPAESKLRPQPNGQAKCSRAPWAQFKREGQ